ncbi:ATP-binding cassette domain-containing protein [Lactobacillus sp. PV037]|uniref:ATP-binding cassette domain-containing protein n=1 Tax=Lactobacillus sp. PV037 TaxID=2594496 RepID=UPI003A0FE4FB
MIIGQAQNLEQRFGANTIFSNVSFSIPDNARIGLVGPNGAGKTTLLKILTGQQEASSGNFTINKGIKVGYIAQENALNEKNTIWDEMESVFANLIQKNKQITQMQIQIAEHPEDQELLKRYDQLAYDFEQEGGFTYQAEIKSVFKRF